MRNNLLTRLIAPLAPIVAAGAISLASLVGCELPVIPTPPNPTPLTKPATPTMDLYPAATEKPSPSRFMQLIVKDYNYDESSLTIERKTSNGTYVHITDLTPDPSGAQLYNDTGLTTSTTYTYRVKANNSSGSSDWYEKTATAPGLQLLQ